MFELGERFQFKEETAYNAVNIVDRSLGFLKISLEKLPLLGITALFMATKYEEILIPHLDNFVAIVPEAYKVTKGLVLQMESIILNEMNFSLGYMSPLLFINCSDKISPFPLIIKNRAITLTK